MTLFIFAADILGYPLILHVSHGTGRVIIDIGLTSYGRSTLSFFLTESVQIGWYMANMDRWI